MSLYLFRNRRFFLFAAGVSTLTLLLILAWASGAWGMPKHQTQTPNLTPGISPTTTVALQQCPRHKTAGAIALFYRHNGAEEVRCIVQDPKAEQNDLDTSNAQILSQRLDSVYAMCTVGGVSASISYSSTEEFDPPSMHTEGDINVFLGQDECETVQKAIWEPMMPVTSVALNPFYAQIDDGNPPAELLHQVPSPECATRNDFFAIWYKDATKVCYANGGFLALAQPLESVTKVCSGKNSGEVALQTSPLTGIFLSLDAEQCVTPEHLLRERTISLNEIEIAAPPVG